jgi:hypothetical protein
MYRDLNTCMIKLDEKERALARREIHLSVTADNLSSANTEAVPSVSTAAARQQLRVRHRISRPMVVSVGPNGNVSE